MSDQVVLQVRMQKQKRESFKKACTTDGRTVAGVVRKLIELYTKGDVKL